MTNLTVFTSEIRQQDGLYSLNDLHKAAGGNDKHRPNQFMRIDTTCALIDELKRCADLRNEPFRVIQGGSAKLQGTFVCKELVYAYAMWISPKFSLAVIRAFDASVESAPAATEIAPAAHNPPATLPVNYGVIDDSPYDLPSMGGRRWLIFRDHRGKEHATPVPHDAVVMTPDQMISSLIATDGIQLDPHQLMKLINGLNQKMQNHYRFLYGSYVIRRS